MVNRYCRRTLGYAKFLRLRKINATRPPICVILFLSVLVWECHGRGEKDLKREEREKGLKRNMCDKRWGLFLRMFGISKNWAVEKVGGLSENKIKQHTCM